MFFRKKYLQPLAFAGGFFIEAIMQVNIDGVHYAAGSGINSLISIAISTHNLADVLKRAFSQQMQHLPAGALDVVIDDGSKHAALAPDGVQLFRREPSLFINDSKNGNRVFSNGSSWRGGPTVDHILAKAHGGTDDDFNLEALCWPCHRTKTARERLR